MFKKIRLLVTYLLFQGLVLSTASFAFTLGNIELLSQDSKPINAKISIIGSPMELLKLKEIKAQIASQQTYQQLGLKPPKDTSSLQISIDKNPQNIPKSINIQSINSEPFNELFEELVVQVSWTGGRIIRVYSILNPNAKVLSVNTGDNLSKITESLIPDLPQASFNQVLTALFRLNPHAFISGNIHRLKTGSKLEVPSRSMVTSIPKEEADAFTLNVKKNYLNKSFAESSEKRFIFSNSNTKDQLKLSSSENETEKTVTEAKLEEDLIAQKKILEQAQARLIEIEKNIADLRKIKEARSENANPQDTKQVPSVETPSKAVSEVKEAIAPKENNFLTLISSFWQWIALFVLLIIFVYGNFFNKMGGATSQSIAHHFNPVDLEENRDSPDQALTTANEKIETPEFAQKIFQSIDLNLDLNLDKRNEATIQERSSWIKPPSIEDQKLRLNLAKSYIKIQDYASARMLLQELINLSDSGQSELISEAKEQLLLIS